MRTILLSALLLSTSAFASSAPPSEFVATYIVGSDCVLPYGAIKAGTQFSIVENTMDQTDPEHLSFDLNLAGTDNTIFQFYHVNGKASTKYLWEPFPIACQYEKLQSQTTADAIIGSVKSGAGLCPLGIPPKLTTLTYELQLKANHSAILSSGHQSCYLERI
jgi:hypothetical protein